MEGYARYGLIVEDPIDWKVSWEGELLAAPLGARDLAVRAAGEGEPFVEIALHGATDLICRAAGEVQLPDGRRLILLRSRAEADALLAEREAIFRVSLERLEGELSEILGGAQPAT